MFHLFKNRRAQLLKLTWQGRSLGGSLPDWALNTLGPTCVFNAKRVIRKLEKRDGFYEVEFKNVPGKLYAPVAMSEFELHQIIAEQFYAWNWHQYQIPQTTIAPGDYVFDCGCCEGLFPFLNHQRAGKFICFEPLEPYRQGLAKTFVDTPNVIVVPEALDTKGTRTAAGTNSTSARIPASKRAMRPLPEDKAILTASWLSPPFVPRERIFRCSIPHTAVHRRWSPRHRAPPPDSTPRGSDGLRAPGAR